MDFAKTIVDWYAQHRRDLPWRDVGDPYKIWLSEVILQQTRVAQGLGYYKRFVSAYPTVEDLARADEDDVMRLWQGLGYYSRARNLLKAAREVARHGTFPTTYEGVRALPGVGDYTAAAICSFAWGMPLPVIDGNVYRVLSRFFGIDLAIDTTEGRKHFAALAAHLLPPAGSADYNQGIMDFGATVCTPSQPLCREGCPLAEACKAAAEQQPDRYPVKSRRAAVRNRFFVYLFVTSEAGVWLHRRGPGDIWQGLYEFPLLEFDHKPTSSDVAAHPAMATLGIDPASLAEIVSGMKHVLTHRILLADCYVASPLRKLQEAPEGLLAVAPDELPRYAMPTLLERIKQRLISLGVQGIVR